MRREKKILTVAGGAVVSLMAYVVRAVAKGDPRAIRFLKGFEGSAKRDIKQYFPHRPRENSDLDTNADVDIDIEDFFFTLFS